MTISTASLARNTASAHSAPPTGKVSVTSTGAPNSRDRRARAPDDACSIPVAAVNPQNAGMQAVSPRRALMAKVSLADVRDPKWHYIGLRPALIDTKSTEFGKQIVSFQQRTAPEALLNSPLRDDVVTSVHGRDADGIPFKFEQGTLASRIEPYLANPTAYAEGGAYSFTAIMVNEGRSVPLEFAKFFPPAVPWHNYFLGSEPEAFPLDLLGISKSSDSQVTVDAHEPKLNTSLILGVGVGNGQEFHFHGGNVFVQVHGEKKWSLFANSDLYSYFESGKPYERRKPCPFAQQYSELFKDIWWKGPVDMPQPIELITRPGDALYLPTGTWHATWNLTDYTFGYTKVIDF